MAIHWCLETPNSFLIVVFVCVTLGVWIRLMDAQDEIMAQYQCVWKHQKSQLMDVSQTLTGRSNIYKGPCTYLCGLHNT